MHIPSYTRQFSSSYMFPISGLPVGGTNCCHAYWQARRRASLHLIPYLPVGSLSYPFAKFSCVPVGVFLIAAGAACLHTEAINHHCWRVCICRVFFSLSLHACRRRFCDANCCLRCMLAKANTYRYRHTCMQSLVLTSKS